MTVKLIYHYGYNGEKLKHKQTVIQKFDNYDHLQHYLENDNASNFKIL